MAVVLKKHSDVLKAEGNTKGTFVFICSDIRRDFSIGAEVFLLYEHPFVLRRTYPRSVSESAFAEDNEIHSFSSCHRLYSVAFYSAKHVPGAYPLEVGKTFKGIRRMHAS